MRAAIAPLFQYTFMAWCSVKAQGQLYIHLHLYLYLYVNSHLHYLNLKASRVM